MHLRRLVFVVNFLVCTLPGATVGLPPAVFEVSGEASIQPEDRSASFARVSNAPTAGNLALTHEQLY